MLKFFKHSYIAQAVVIVLLIAVLWIPAFLTQSNDQAYEYPTTPMYDFVLGIMGNSNIAMTIFVMLLFGSCVFVFNSMMTVDNLVPRYSSIFSFVMVLCMCCVPINNEYYPFLIALPLMVMAQQTVFLIYNVEKPERYLMNTGIFIALGSMFYIPAILMIVWVLFALIVHGVRELRLYLIPIAGLVTPYFLMTVIIYISGNSMGFINDYTNAFASIGLTKLDITTMEKVVLLVMIILSVLSILKIWSSNVNNLISTRHRKKVTMVLFCLSVLMLFTQNPVMSNGYFFMIVSILVSMALCYVKKTKLVDIVMVVLMIAVIVNQYLPLFGIKI